MGKSNITRNLSWIILSLLGTLTLAAVLTFGLIFASTTHPAETTPERMIIEAEQVNAVLAADQPTLPPPTATPVPPTPTPTPFRPVIHVVESGETLLHIALQYGVTVDDITRFNNLDDANFLSIGQQLLIPINLPPPTPTITPTAAPVDSDGQPQGRLYACPANASARPLALPADPIRLVLSAGWAYFIADGNLYTAPLDELVGKDLLAPSSVMPPERKIGQYTIRELVYAAVDFANGDLILLDKSNDIYRRTTSGEWRMEIAAAPIPGQSPNPQYLAVQPFGGNLYVLDADLSHIWKLPPGTATPAPYYTDSKLSNGVDIAIPMAGTGNDTMIVLTGEGLVFKFTGGRRDGAFSLPAGIEPITWPAQVLASGKRLLVADGEGRRVISLDPSSGQVEWQVTFRFPSMRRLRSAALAGDTLYALAGRRLYVAQISALSGECPPVTYDNTLYFDDLDLRALTAGFRLPFPGDSLPTSPRFYPGARRLYRYGLNYGLELYSPDLPGLESGSAVSAIADGIITRADTAYVEMKPKEYEAILARAEAEHQTPPDSLDKLLGRQVRIAHGFGMESHYAYLSAIAPGVNKDDTVQTGNPVGNVGVSGTSAAVYGTPGSPRLHLEIWINDRYLGQGLSLYETMRLWQAMFE